MSSSAWNSRAMRVAIIFTLAFFTSLFAFSQQPKHLMTNDDVIKMAKGGFTDDVLVAMIEANDTDFDISINGLTALKDAGISSKVMEAMLKAEARKRQGGSAAPAQQPATAPPPQQNMVPNPATSMGGPGGSSAYVQSMIASAMSSSGMGGMPGMLDVNQLPPLNLIAGDAKQPVRASVAQVANTETKGDSMPGVGSGARSMLMGLASQALRFSAISGGMLAGPGGMMAMSAMSGGMGIMGGGGRRHGPPKVTYVWALPGAQSSFAAPSNRPRFEMLYGDLVGIDPDAYEPFLVRLVNSKDNWRLVGATKSTMGQMSTEAYEKVTEERIAVKAERLGRGHVQIEPKEPLEPGEYAVVLRALHPGKRSAGSLGGGAETTIFFAVWDFSVR